MRIWPLGAEALQADGFQIVRTALHAVAFSYCPRCSLSAGAAARLRCSSWFRHKPASACRQRGRRRPYARRLADRRRGDRETAPACIARPPACCAAANLGEDKALADYRTHCAVLRRSAPVPKMLANQVVVLGKQAGWCSAQARKVCVHNGASRGHGSARNGYALTEIFGTVTPRA